MSIPSTPNNAPVYWEVNSPYGWLSLHTYAWSVKSFGGRRWVAGPKRGEDVSMPYHRGRIWVPKTRDAQAYDMTLWIFPLTEYGQRDPGKTIEQKAHENFRKIIKYVDTEGQVQLRKRWYDESSTTESPVVISATGVAEFLDASGPDSDDGHGYEMSLSFFMTDPYFYGNYMDIQTVPSGSTGLTSNDLMGPGLTLGEAPSDHLLIEIDSDATSPANFPTITFPDGNWIQVNENPGTTAITIDCRRGLAMRCSLESYISFITNGGTAPGNYVNGFIRRNPYNSSWPMIDPSWGADPLNPKSILKSGSGTIRLTYQPAYR